MTATDNDPGTAARLINEGAPFSALRRCFKDRKAAFTYYGQHHAAASLAALADPRCLVCGVSSDLLLVKLGWRVFIRTLRSWLIVIVSGAYGGAIHSSPPLQFETRCRLCRACWKRWQVRRVGWDLVTALGWLLGFAAAIAAAFHLYSAYFDLMKPDERQRAMLIGWSAVASIVVAAVVIRLGMRMRLPPALRAIGRRPVELESVNAIDTEVAERHDAHPSR